ncbi:MAG: hypothetical protein HQ582_29315, partial [Planctomycetes bacterium]|nr:hypothetical protein [Planctomycetota bacterium]
VSFRHRFAREFDHVCWALAPRRLVILIDDLDRCRPSNVLDVLEAINFLASSGECFIVAGMEMESVVRCVGFGLRGVAEELEERGENEREGEAPEDRARRLRVRYARRYLEKLINIEVPIPQMTEEQLERLVTFDEVAPDVTPTPPAARGRFRWARGRRRIRLWYQQAPRWLRACLWVTVALGLVLVGYLVGQLTRREDSQSTPAGQSTPNDETGSPDQEGPPPAPPLDT